jgi:penicillin-binding protein 1C
LENKQPGKLTRVLTRWMPGRRVRRGVLAVALCAGAAWAVAWAALEIALRHVPFDAAKYETKEISTTLFDRNGKPLRAYLGTDERWRIPVKIDEVSPWLVKATIAVEDKRFYSHHGVDWIAVGRALLSDIRHARIVSGASTISMQVAALNQPRDRSVARKLKQAFHAMQLERHLTKAQILELYLTNAPYGGNVCGVEAAARRYFNKSAKEVSLSEAAMLAGVPQSPSRLRPDRRGDNALKRRKHVLDTMLASGAVPRDDYERVVSRKPSAGNFNTSVKAPHFCELVHARYGGHARLDTTVDANVQRQAELLLAQRVSDLRPQSVSNGAAVVIDNASGDVLAMVGSINFNDTAIDGQVNGATAPRSPGSTLKPFIYAFAYKCGNLLPSSVLFDVPQQYPQYVPENFDKAFRGLVPADRALAWSLNVPAIQVLNETGLSRSLQFIQSCGMDTLQQPAGDYGLSLAIGSCGVSLLELTNAYAMLARGGQYKPYRVVQGTRESAGGKQRGIKLARPADEQLLTPAACYFVNRALADVELRNPEHVDSSLSGLEGVAWKTGTSSGFRDAWTVAYDRYHTVGVWLGNFDGHGSRALVGAQAAAPVALKLIERLRPTRKPDFNWPARPASGLRKIVVCSESGYPAGEDCPTTRVAEAPVVSPDDAHGVLESAATCAVHRRVRVDAATGQQLCMRCIGGHTIAEHVYAFWPASAASWLANNAGESVLAPAHNSECPTIARGPELRITSPIAGDSFILTGGRSASAQKVSLEAAAPPGSSKLYWFLDGELVAQVDRAAAAYLAPTSGTHRLRCVDDAGHADWVTFTVSSD